MLIPSAIGHSIIRHDVLDSTSRHAWSLLSKSNPSHGTVIIADYQTDGQGQIGRKWWAEQGNNLLLSIIIKPNFVPISHQCYLNYIVALSLFDVLCHFRLTDLAVKWPNDIYVAHQKIAGILIQCSLRKDRIDHSVIGIGLNINQNTFPADIPNPIGLSQLTGQHHDIESIMYDLLDHLNRLYFMLEQKQYLKIKSMYEQHLFGIGQRRTFRDKDATVFHAEVIGVNEIGALLLKADDQIRSYQHGELEWIH